MLLLNARKHTRFLNYQNYKRDKRKNTLLHQRTLISFFRCLFPKKLNCIYHYINIRNPNLKSFVTVCISGLTYQRSSSTVLIAVQIYAALIRILYT